MARPRAHLLEIDPEHPEPYRLRQAVERLIDGQVVLYPTDTIYGLGADLSRHDAVDKIYSARKLDRRKPLSLVCASLSEASRYAIIDDDCYRVMRRVLPGPYTFVLRATKDVPRMGDKQRRTVGIRIPGNPVSVALVRALGHPLLSASAIEDGAEEPGVSDPVRLAERYTADVVALVLDAGILDGTPSSVIDWSGEGPKVLRAGAGDVSIFE